MRRYKLPPLKVRIVHDDGRKPTIVKIEDPRIMYCSAFNALGVGMHAEPVTPRRRKGGAA